MATEHTSGKDMSGSASGHHHMHGHGHGHKSFKRKYRKLKLRFDAVMKQSDDLFAKDITATAQVKRITEENNRLLDLLFDLNNSTHIPKHRRYNIGSPSCSTPVGFLSPDQLATFQNADNEDIEPVELGASEVARKLQGIAGQSNVEDTDCDDDDDDNDYDDDEDDDEDEDFPRDIPEYNDLSGSELELEELREERYRRRQPTTPPLYVRKGLEAQERRRQARLRMKREGRLRARKLGKKDGRTTNGKATNGAMKVKIEPPDTTTTPTASLPADKKQSQMTVDTAQKPRILLYPDDLYKPGSTPPYLRDPSPFLLTAEEEEEYYANIDQHMDRNPLASPIPSNPSAAATASIAAGGNGDEDQVNADTSLEASGPRNPMSVYCWLKRNQPQIFLQELEGEGGGSGPGRKPRGKTGPKKKDKAVLPMDVMGDEEELAARSVVGGSGIKRKRVKPETDDGFMTPLGQRVGVVPGSSSGKSTKTGSGGRGRKKKDIGMGEEEGTPLGKKVKR